MLSELSQAKRAAVAERWLAALLATYGEDTAAFLAGRRDRFANPVGRTFADATAAIVDEFLGGMDATVLCTHLEEIVKIRAVQELTPAEAVSFVFMLKDALREEVDADLDTVRSLEDRIDQLALFAFDIYVKRREQVYDLRLREIRDGFVKPA
jgi:hypothetical protein